MKIYPKILTVTIALMIIPSLFFIFYFTNNIERNGDKFIENRLYKRYLNIKLFFDSIKGSLALKITKSINSNDLDSLYRYFDYVKIIDIPEGVDDISGVSKFSSSNDIILTNNGIEILIKMPYGYKNKNISSYIELSKNISQDALLKNYYADVSEKFAIYEVNYGLDNGDKDKFRLIKSEFYDSYNNNIVTNLGDDSIMKKVLDNKQYFFEKNKFISYTAYDMIYFPLRNENNIIGVYIVGIQKVEMSSVISSMKFNVLFLIFIEVILAVLSTFLISRILVNPIHKIELFSNKVADGDFSYQLKIDSNDEIANLADNINIMVNKLNYTKLLEEKVKERTADLEKAKMEAERVSKNKTNLLSNISHELRTPLNSINGISGLFHCGGFERNYEIVNGINKILNNDACKDSIKHQLNKIKQVFESGDNVKLSIFENLKDFFPEIFLNEELMGEYNEILNICADEESEKQKAYKYIKESGDHLLKLIDMIMNISLLDSGKVEVDNKVVNFPDVVSSIKTDAENFLKIKNKTDYLTITFNVNKNIQKIIMDQNKYKYILFSLITNAIKFSDKGGISLNIDIKDGNLTTSVKDEGRGIKEEDKDKIFTEFGKTNDAANSLGLGLGLVETKKVVELLSGEIGFESVYGTGSEFWFEIPYNES